MMDAGVKLEHPVAGIAMGLVMEGDKYAILTDIAGAEVLDERGKSKTCSYAPLPARRGYDGLPFLSVGLLHSLPHAGPLTKTHEVPRPAGLTGRIGNSKLVANPVGQEVGDSTCLGTASACPVLRVLPKGMLLAFCANDAPAAAEVP